MFYGYILKSLLDDDYYKGHCENIEQRLAEHNRGQTKSNKSYIPFVVCYFEVFVVLEEAIKREKYFKTAVGDVF